MFIIITTIVNIVPIILVAINVIFVSPHSNGVIDNPDMPPGFLYETSSSNGNVYTTGNQWELNFVHEF
jgi:hypothetical protein